MILNCLIIDDEPIARKLLQEYIEETDFLALVGTADNPVKATGLLNDLNVDLIFFETFLNFEEMEIALQATPKSDCIIVALCKKFGGPNKHIIHVVLCLFRLFCIVQ